jgi:hypothetical protein
MDIRESIRLVELFGLGQPPRPPAPPTVEHFEDYFAAIRAAIQGMRSGADRAVTSRAYKRFRDLMAQGRAKSQGMLPDDRARFREKLHDLYNWAHSA